MRTGIQELKWYVVYTRPNSERVVASGIEDLGIEAYLPLHKVIRQWRDRKKRLEVPLFPNYVFVKTNDVRRVALYSIRDLVKFVSIEKKPVVLHEREITAIKKVLNEDVEVFAEEYFQEGMMVKIRQGQFSGMQGVIIKKYGKTRLMIKIEGLMKAFSFNIPAASAEAVISN